MHEHAVLRAPRDISVKALHVATYKGCIEAASLLVQKGANIDCVDRWGDTPLAWTNDSRMARFLIEIGASLTPILTDRIPKLLDFWGQDHKTMIDLYKQAVPEIPGSSLAEICDFVPGRSWDDPEWEGRDTLEAMRIIGLDPNNLESSHTLHINRDLSSYESQSLFLNSEFDIQALDPFPWDWHDASLKTLIPPLLDTFRHFRRRFSHKKLKRWLNLEPRKGWSPLCRAASQGHTQVMENCLSMDADIDFEGCPLGSALMIASACGILESVKLLVRRGASVCYIGKRGPINAYLVARSKAVKRWLLVDRFHDQLRIKSADAHTASRQLKFWSGTAKAIFELSGMNKQQWEESTLEYATKLAGIRQDLRGRALVRIEGLVFPEGSASDRAKPSQAGELGGREMSSGRIIYDIGWITEDADRKYAAEVSPPRTESLILESSTLAPGTYHQPGGLGFTVTVRDETYDDDNIENI